MRNLKNILENFRLEPKDIAEIKNDKATDYVPNSFIQVAAAILGGHFIIKSIGDTEVKVIPTCVEIYYHEEHTDGIKDFIVYHRNTSKSKKDIFPFGILHNHVSGIDITFEKGDNKDNAIRASALIREFRIENGQNTTTIELKEKEKRSTYIYGALFSQFNIFDGFTIQWVDDRDIPLKEIIPSHRKNVMKYNDKIEKTNIPDERKWQFKLKQQ